MIFWGIYIDDDSRRKTFHKFHFLRKLEEFEQFALFTVTLSFHPNANALTFKLQLRLQITLLKACFSRLQAQ